MHSEDERLDVDWGGFDVIFRALCLAVEPTHAFALLFVDEDSRPKPATPAELRWQRDLRVSLTPD